MTIDTFTLLAKYNSFANTGMNKTIAQLSAAEWEKEFGGYYKNIKSLCAHLYIADFNWLKRFGSLRSFGVLKKPIFGNAYDLGGTPFVKIDEYLAKREELDGLIASLVDELTQRDLDGTLVYKNFRNEEQKRRADGVLLHLFNHETHHRAMISLYLELLGKPNDFSSLFLLV